MDLEHNLRGRPPSIASLPEYLITTFLPGARPFLTRYPTLLRLLAVLTTIWYFSPFTRLKTLWTQFSSTFTSTIIVHSDEDLFEYLVTFLSSHPTLRFDHTLIATSTTQATTTLRARHRRYPSDDDLDPAFARQYGSNNPNAPKIKYEQSQGHHLFISNRTLFLAHRTHGDGHTYDGGRSKRMELLSITCLGRSPVPIKNLLENVYTAHKATEQSLTIIRRPYDSGGYRRLAWSRVTAKPRRDLSTVILDKTQKEEIVKDVDEYMDPSTQQFYGSHGIPYRRGYLFYGPPGTGKTSLALALASRFELDVYVMTLLDRDIGDSELISLLNQLPGRSLLLLEDIDTAGLNRSSGMPRGGGLKMKDGFEGVIDEDNDEAGDGEESDDEDEKRKKPSSRVTLSGLLNAIDGVAAPEGHILIMTTNKPDQLDEALVRAGRVSVRVGFGKATRNVAEGIFLKMFSPLPGSPDSITPVIGKTDEVKALAREFAGSIEDYEYSPADLQDYFLVRKKDARQAVAEVGLLRAEKEKLESERRTRRLFKVEKEGDREEIEGDEEQVDGEKAKEGKGQRAKEGEGQRAKEGEGQRAKEGEGQQAKEGEGQQAKEGEEQQAMESSGEKAKNAGDGEAKAEDKATSATAQDKDKKLSAVAGAGA